MSEEKIISFEIYAKIGVGRGPVGLDPMFRAIDALNQSKVEDKVEDKVDAKNACGEALAQDSSL